MLSNAIHDSCCWGIVKSSLDGRSVSCALVSIGAGSTKNRNDEAFVMRSQGGFCVDMLSVGPSLPRTASVMSILPTPHAALVAPLSAALLLSVVALETVPVGKVMVHACKSGCFSFSSQRHSLCPLEAYPLFPHLRRASLPSAGRLFCSWQQRCCDTARFLLFICSYSIA